MIRLAALALLLFTACGNSPIPSTTTTEPGRTAGQAFEDFFAAQGRGQYGRVYELLHPAQRDRLTAADFEQCMRATFPTFTLENFSVVDTYEEEVTVPGTNEPVDAVAVTWEAEVAGEPHTATNHVVQVDGGWYGYLANDTLAGCESVDGMP